MSGWCSSIAATNFSGGHLHAEVDHLEAGALEHDVDEVLADVVDVALDRAHQELADRSRTPVSASSGRSTSIAPAIARPAISISGTKKSPRSNRAPTSSSEGISASKSRRLRLHAERERLVGQLEDARGVADQRLVVEALEDLVGCGHAAPSFAVSVPCGSARSSADSCVGLVDQQPTELVEPVLEPRRWARRCRGRRPRRRRGPRTGAATPVSPTSSSSTVTAKPRRRTSRQVALAASPRSVMVRRGRPLEPTGRAASSAPQAKKTLPSAEQCAGTSTCGPVAGAEQVGESTWATCTTRSPRATLRCTVSPVSSPIALQRRAGQPDELPRHGSCRAAYSQKSAAGDVAAGRRRARAARCARGRRAGARSWTGPARRPRCSSAKRQRLVGAHDRGRSAAAARSTAWVPCRCAVLAHPSDLVEPDVPSCGTDVPHDEARMPSQRRSSTADPVRRRSPMFRNRCRATRSSPRTRWPRSTTGWRRLVTEIGVEFMSDRALDLFREAGQKVEDNTVFLDPDFVLEQVAKAPREFDVQARNPDQQRAHRRRLDGVRRGLRPAVRARGRRTPRRAPWTTSATSPGSPRRFAGARLGRRRGLRAQRHPARQPAPRHDLRAADADRQDLHGQRRLRRQRRATPSR